MRPFSLAELRRCFAEELRATAPVRFSEAVVDAFATVPREAFFGPGPWRVLPSKSLDSAYVTPDADPRWLYHDVLISIDHQRGINNGEPGLWARLFDKTPIRPGDRIMQVGSGTGYYTAIMAELVGSKGHVIAVEYAPDLADEARKNLAPWPQVDVVRGDGTVYDPGLVDVVVVFAGATHPAKIWLDRLSEDGRLLMPLTDDNHHGFFLKATRHGTAFDATSLGSCGFIHCIGNRDMRAAKRLHRCLRLLEGRPIPIRSLHQGTPSSEQKGQVWFAASGFWLSQRNWSA